MAITTENFARQKHIDYCYFGQSSQWNSSCTGLKLFDEDIDTMWVSSGGPTQWAQIRLRNKRIAQRLGWRARNDGYLTESPKDFTLKASNTGAFGGEEVTLLTVTNETDWSLGELRTWDFTGNTTGYLYYRVVVTANNGGSNVSGSEMQLFPPDNEQTLLGYNFAFGPDVTGGGTVTVSSYYGTGYEGSKAIDDNDATFWAAGNVSPPSWWKIDLGSGVTKTPVVLQLRMRPDDYYSNNRPEQFVLEGSNTGAFSGEQDTLLSVNEDAIPIPWKSYLLRFYFSNTKAYRFFRIYITDHNSIYGVGFAEVMLNEASSDAGQLWAQNAFEEVEYTDTPQLQALGLLEEAEYTDVPEQRILSVFQEVEYVAQKGKVTQVEVEVEYLQDAPVDRVTQVTVEVEYVEAPEGFPVNLQEIGVQSLPVTGFYEYKRKFPVFDENQQYETQPGRMRFPWLT